MPIERQTRVGIDFSKFERHPDAQVYEEGLRRAIDSYKLPRKVFTGSQDRVIKGTIRILTAYDMDPKFCDDPEKNLFALAIGDQFFRSARNAERLKNALNMLKVVAVDERENRTLSGYIRSLAERNEPRGTLFDPKHPEANLDQNYYQRIARYIDLNEDTRLSQELAALLGDRGTKSLLCDCRTDLSITPDNEDPYQVSVLSKTTQQIEDDLGFQAYTSDHREVTTIVVGSDWNKRPATVIHEYLHTQEAVDFTRGLKRLMFDGAREALLSLYEKGDSSYYWITEAMLTLFKHSPDLKQPFGQAFRGDADARKLLLAEVTGRFGFEGLLALAFMWDTERESEAHDPVTNRIRRAARIEANYVYPIFESPGYIWRW